MVDGELLREMTAYYADQGAPQDQQMLIALLREAQEAEGGVLSPDTLCAVAKAYSIKDTMLQAIIRRIPGLRCSNAPHTLEICGTCRAGAKLRNFVEKTYGVKSGTSNEAAGFLYRVTPCMKNCKNGPSVRWDGKLISHADEAIIREMIAGRMRFP